MEIKITMALTILLRLFKGVSLSLSKTPQPPLILLDFASSSNWPDLLNNAIAVGIVEIVQVDSRIDVTRDHLHAIAHRQMLRPFPSH